jgi:hypothetical protein
MQNTRSRMAQTADRDVTLGRLAVSRAEAADLRRNMLAEKVLRHPEHRR